MSCQIKGKQTQGKREADTKIFLLEYVRFGEISIKFNH